MATNSWTSSLTPPSAFYQRPNGLVLDLISSSRIFHVVMNFSALGSLDLADQLACLIYYTEIKFPGLKDVVRVTKAR